MANRNNQNTDNSGFHLRIEANDEEKNALKQYSEKDKQIVKIEKKLNLKFKIIIKRIIKLVL